MSAALDPGTLLLGAVGVGDGVFDQAVVLILDADESGRVGVILNKISRYDLAEALPEWAGLVSEPRRLFDGGPVSKRGGICLATPVADDAPPGWRKVYGRVGLLNLDTPVEIAAGAYSEMRIFAGYAGWDAGQLELEIERGLWYTVPAEEPDPFDPAPDTLWARVLRRQGGDLALYSTWTLNSGLN